MKSSGSHVIISVAFDLVSGIAFMGLVNGVVLHKNQ